MSMTNTNHPTITHPKTKESLMFEPSADGKYITVHYRKNGFSKWEPNTYTMNKEYARYFWENRVNNMGYERTA